MARFELQIIGERMLQHPVNHNLLVYCPSMDLLAIGTTTEQVQIYRLNGQQVHNITQRASEVRVQSITWKPDGQLLAIAWSDGFVRLVAAESSKTVHQIRAAELEHGFVTCLGWTSNSTLRASVASKPNKQQAPWEELLESQDGGISPNLPNDIVLLDLEVSVPKLSTIPSGTTIDDIFGTRASLDAIFRPFDPKDIDTVNIMIVGISNGSLHLSIYDSFIIGTFPLPSSIPGSVDNPRYLIRHAAHRAYSTHSLLVQSDKRLYFVPLDLRFVSASSEYLSLLASKSTTLQNLLRYIQSVQSLMSSEWKATRDLPSRFLSNIDETLSEKGTMNIVQAMYHSVATGHTLPAVKEWLVDELAERGHKRWDKAVTTGLENLRKLVHENMLPALERCSIILSRLNGIAKFRGTDDTTGYSSQQINLISDTISCLNLVCAKILTSVVEEIDLFAAFSSWLRHEIDSLASSSSSSTDELGIEKESGINHSKVLSYIQSSMTESPLAVFFRETSSEDYQKDWAVAEQGLPLFELLDGQLRKHEIGQPYMKALPRVDFLCKYLERQASTIFLQIAGAEKRNVLLGQPVELVHSPSETMVAMRVCFKNENHCLSYIAVASTDTVHINRMEIMITNGISKVVSTAFASCSLEEHSARSMILDVAFMDDKRLLVLWLNATETIIQSIPYSAAGELSYVSSSSSDDHKQPNPLKDSGTSSRIPRDSNFEPAKMEVREAKVTRDGARPCRICLLDKTGTKYKVIRLPDGNDNNVAAS